MPDCCVNEPIPHILKAEKDAPDTPAPLVWVYPMREYTAAHSEEALAEMNIGDNFICSAINGGLPLCCVTSTDSFLNHGAEIYSGRIIISPSPESKELRAKLYSLADMGVGVVIYATPGMLERLDDACGITKIDSTSAPEAIIAALENYGYSIRFDKKEDGVKPPTIALYGVRGGLMLSAYSANTTTDTRLRFPLGAPIFCGIDAEISDGYSSYRFSRSEHRECRIFLEQASGTVVCREAAPVSARYRRFIRISGLRDATVHLFSEPSCECAVSRLQGDYTPSFDKKITYITPEHILLEHIDGDIYFLIGHKNTV